MCLINSCKVPDNFWSGDPSIDPWEWRGILAARGNVAYGKFFNRTAGFISREWFPIFANYLLDLLSRKCIKWDYV